MDWPNRFANLVLEASEFAEAARGKGVDKVKEAGDILLTFLLAIAAADVTWEEAIGACTAKVAELRTRPKYDSEFTARDRTAARPEVFA